MTSDPLTGRSSQRERHATPISSVGSGWLLASLLVMALVVPRWMAERSQAPLESVALPGGAVILVVQPGDCPDRAATLRRWLLTLPPTPTRRPEDPSAPSPGPLAPTVAPPDFHIPDIHIGVVGPRDLPLPAPLTDALKGFARLPSADAQVAGRTLTRLGVEGTPALLAVDARGRPILVSDFTPDGRIPGLELALRLGLPGLDPHLLNPIPSPPPETPAPPPSNPR